jgi:hypothetical protein
MTRLYEDLQAIAYGLGLIAITLAILLTPAFAVLALKGIDLCLR